MVKEALIKLATGVIAKLLRYTIASAGAVTVEGGVNNPNPSVEQVAAGISAIAVSIGWSLWEDYVKKKAAIKYADSVK